MPATVLQPVSVGLKFGFVAVLYLFLIWVAWSAIRDLRRGRGAPAMPDRSAAPDATGMYDAASSGLGETNDFEPRLLVERAAGHQSGVARECHVLVIEDLGSTNGTYLNEEPLSGPQPLYDGDRIRIGDSEFSYLQ